MKAETKILINGNRLKWEIEYPDGSRRIQECEIRDHLTLEQLERLVFEIKMAVEYRSALELPAGLIPEGTLITWG